TINFLDCSPQEFPLQRPFLVLAMLAAILASLRIAPSASVASAATPRLKNHAPAQLAQVRYILHGLSVRPPGKGARKGAVKMALFDRYGLQTSSNQKASIGFHDGTVLHINENTDAVLSGHVTHVNRGEVAEYLAPGTDHRVETDA